jgi:D-glycero-beta-D-manno-heptose 1-phosphate adenylyltransferase
MPKLWSNYSKNKWIEPENLDKKVTEIRSEKKNIATLNGSFDILHAGHLHIIFEASQMGDVLIVALNTDRSIQGYKGPKRPIIPLEYRLQMMAAIEFVDFVTWFDEADPRKLLTVIKPDVHVNGAEYGENCIEAETVRIHGGKIHIVQLIPGLSTSCIVKKINDLQS